MNIFCVSIFILYMYVLEPTCAVRLGKRFGIRFFYLLIYSWFKISDWAVRKKMMSALSVF